MNLEEIKSILIQKFGESVIVGEETTGLQPALLIDPDRIADVCLELRDNPKTYFDFLSCLSGVDYGVEANRFGVVYHLASIPYQTQLTLKISKENNRNLLLIKYGEMLKTCGIKCQGGDQPIHPFMKQVKCVG